MFHVKQFQTIEGIWGGAYCFTWNIQKILCTRVYNYAAPLRKDSRNGAARCFMGHFRNNYAEQKQTNLNKSKQSILCIRAH